MTVTTLRTRALLPVLASALIVLSACGGSSSAGTAGTGGTTARTVKVNVTITAGKVTPAPTAVEAKKGDHVEITVTSDRADEVHVHGYDIEKPLVAGQPTTIDFDATQAGRFEVETHESEKVLFQLLVR